MTSSRLAKYPRRRAFVLSVLLLGIAACEPRLVVGDWSCPASDAATGGTGGTTLPVVDVPWSTSFETGLCDFSRAGGFCYGDPDASLDVVDSPVHSGRRAAAMSVTSASAQDGKQARCVLQGTLPVDATYGAWFFLPTLASNNMDNWNLFHFQGGEPDDWHGLWDVSLDTAADGSLILYILDVLGGALRVPSAAPAVPIGKWFHVEFRLRRAQDNSGEVALYQDGTLLLQLSSVVTDDTTSAQWYVGNLASAIIPQEYTLYLDDVTIKPTP